MKLPSGLRAMNIIEKLKSVLHKVKDAVSHRLDAFRKVDPAGATPVTSDDVDDQPFPELRGEAVFGAAVIAAFFIGFMGWAALAPLEAQERPSSKR